MTKVLVGDNVNSIFPDALWWLKVAGHKEDSRNGPVLVAPGPVVSEYRNPDQRLLFNPQRDANPVFHLMEAIWMLAGENDVRWLLPFNARMEQYTDDGVNQHGAYGYRWREHFAVDQIGEIIEELSGNRDSRRAVMAMWDPTCDLRAAVRDVPCNTHIYFDCRGNKLNMTVCNRSNDLLWGCYGANVVHMSILQEVIAHGVGLEMGVYRQFSNNLHVYLDLPMAKELLEVPPYADYDLYASGSAKAIPLLRDYERWEDFVVDCEEFVLLDPHSPEDPRGFTTEFMRTVALPLYNAYIARKAGEPIDWESLPECDWTTAFTQWVGRRNK